ncbi:MAG: ASKHA domain-containing protein [Oscillospiraceae bacterium]|nr:ASKHA domain-containing protein [Oscillospiraceae bacterium]
MTVTLLSRAGTMTLSADPGQSLLDLVRAREGLPIHAPCGGQGTCGKCTVYLVDGRGETPVLACRTPARDGMVVRLPDAAPLCVESAASTDAPVVPDGGQEGFGVACDIGTTTVVCHLMDLATGRCLATVGEGNAQRSYGGDVIARIKASMEGRRSALTCAIVDQLSRMIGALCRHAGIETAEVRKMAVAANTTMLHLFAALPPDGMGAAPFTPVSLFGDEWDAKALGLPFEGSVYLLPAVSGYVGGDITADLLAAGLAHEDRPVLLIDVGTNGEMALGCGDYFVCCSTAAGPAFEGAQICCGMAAAAGAVSQVEYRDGEVRCSVIGGGEAVGLCGSGLIDAMAVMLRLGAVDETGRMLDIEEDEDEIPEEALPYLFLWQDSPAFRLSEKVWVTQADVRKLQLGKGAIAAGVRVLMDAYGVGFEGVSALLLAGGFGNYIRPESAARIGLIPAELLSVTRPVGNTAAKGAQMALLSSAAREELARLQKNMDYRELSGLPAFNEAYMEAMMFPEEE